MNLTLPETATRRPHYLDGRSKPALAGPILSPRDGRPPRELIVFLHGVASNGDIVLPLRQRLRTSFPQALIVAPHAPEPYPVGPHAFRWWDLADFKPKSLAVGVRQAAPALNQYIDQLLAASGLTEERLVLAGFSQGAMLAMHVAMARRRRIAGVVAFSGMLAHRALPWRMFAQKPPMLLIHGTEDTVVPPDAYFDAIDRLSAYGCTVQARMRTGLGHKVNGVGYAHCERFIRRVLDYDR